MTLHLSRCMHFVHRVLIKHCLEQIIKTIQFIFIQGLGINYNYRILYLCGIGTEQHVGQLINFNKKFHPIDSLFARIP